MIVVVSLNPAIDITHEVSDPDWKGVNRPHAVHVRPGGKGVNVARVLARFAGSPVRLIGLAGGGTGAELAELLAGSGVDVSFNPVRGETRRTFTVVDSASGDAALFSEPGPVVNDGEYQAFLGSYQDVLGQADVVVLSGSLPGGLGQGTYAELIRAAGVVPVILDSSGAALAAGAAAGPAVVKPNLAELGELAGRELQSTAEVEAAARSLAGTVVVSLGAEGLLAVTPDGSWLARPGEVVLGNPTGAGDAVVAGLADGLVRGLPWPERLRQAVALGAACVAAPAAGEFSGEEYQRQLPLVEVTSRWG